MSQLLLVAAGGAVGATLRHLSGMAAMRLFGAGFPWGTVFVNVFGSFLMGLFIELAARRFGASQEVRLFVATGCLGGFTTFSTFTVETAELLRDGRALAAAVYVLGSVTLGLAAAATGFLVGSRA